MINNLNAWDSFAKSGKIDDYISYKNSVSQSTVKSQGEAKNEHKDRRDNTKRAEYR
ncbi:MAG: hypothetical protein LBH71_03205 [Oscillospiraceae bacterium]|nr:hypothetical protein [Oscillospiraceae bacterium]